MDHGFLVHQADDDVGVAVTDLEPGRDITGIFMDTGDRTQVHLVDAIPLGHKVSLTELAPGATVKKYGVPIGLVTAPIRVGQHVHTHNLRSARWH